MSYIKELVIAAYNRDLTWLNEIQPDVKISVYRKGTKTSNDNEIFLENNVGRCVHTFFTHIYNRYEDLAQLTFFAQDYPFDHWENLVKCVNFTEENLLQTSTIQYGGYYGNTIIVPFFHRQAQQVGNGRVFACNGDGTPHHHGVEVERYWQELFNDPSPGVFEFNPGGHFAITREHVYLRSRNFYKKVIELLEREELAPYAIERLENYIFNSTFSTKL